MNKLVSNAALGLPKIPFLYRISPPCQHPGHMLAPCRAPQLLSELMRFTAARGLLPGPMHASLAWAHMRTPPISIASRAQTRGNKLRWSVKGGRRGALSNVSGQGEQQGLCMHSGLATWPGWPRMQSCIAWLRGLLMQGLLLRGPTAPSSSGVARCTFPAGAGSYLLTQQQCYTDVNILRGCMAHVILPASTPKPSAPPSGES